MFWQPDINPAQGPYKVLLARGEFIDPARENRDVPYKIYYPTEHGQGKLPVIFWSHGFGGNRDGASFISRFVSSYGYIIVHLTHRGTDSSLWEGKPGHPWDILRTVHVERATTLNRFKDVTFALDQLENWAKANPEIGGHMDFSKLGISGHSFGALTAQVIAGQLIPDETHTLASFRDARFRAGIAYSPVPIAHMTGKAPETIYNHIAIPLLHMTGTDDDSPLEGFTYDQRLLVFNHSGDAPRYLLIKKGGDHMVYNGTRGKLGENPLREKHEEIIKLVSLAFWDAYLKDNKKALAWLTQRGLPHYIGAGGEFKAILND